jgi:hypothetical protein
MIETNKMEDLTDVSTKPIISMGYGVLLYCTIIWISGSVHKYKVGRTIRG